MAEILLYGVIGDPDDKLDAATVTTAIRASSGPLAVRINSPGGYVMEGLAIIAALRAYAGPITIYIDGLAASMASAIAMVGTNCVMAESAMLMVHKPWDASIGNADDLRADAAKLDRIEAQLVGIYAQRTGLPDAELATMLAAETWFDAEQALAAGFVTSIAQPLKLAAMAKATGYGFRHLPDRLKEDTMTETAQAVAEERTRISTIMALGGKHRVPDALTQRLITGGTPLAEARAAILDHLATEGDRLNIGHAFNGGHQTLDDPTVYNTAVRDALVAKISGKPATGPAAEFQGMSVVNIGRDYLARQGTRDVLRMSPDRVIGHALQHRGARASSYGFGSGPIAGGMHTTSDFPDLIGGAAEKFLIDRYKVQQTPLLQLARRRDVNNFLTHYGIQMSGFGALDTVNEAGEFKNRSITNRKEGYAIQTYGDIFAVSRQMLVNDALGALADILQVMAAGAADTEALALVSVINSNVNLSDGQPWFSSTHGNLAPAGTVPSIVSMDVGRVAMRSQKDADGTSLIDANPKFILVPVALQTNAEQLVASVTAPTTEDVNPFAGKLTPLAEPRLTNPTAWYLFADPDFSPALQYSYLDGQEAPQLATQDGWRIDGTEYRVRHDFGAGVLDSKMAWKNPGA